MIPATLLVLAMIGYLTFIERPSSASTSSPMQGQVPEPIRTLPGLQSLTFHIQNSIFGGPTPFSFAVNSSELSQRRADPLSISNNDFVGLEGVEFDDVFYSDSNGVPNPEGRYVTIESVYNRSDNAGLRLAEVQLNFAGGRVENFNQVASFVRLGGTAGTERFAADGELLTNAQMGNTIGQTVRLRLTLGFLVPGECSYSIQPASQSFPGFLPIGIQTATFNVSAPNGCQWNVELEDPQPNFIDVIEPLPISGSRAVAYHIFANPGAAPRTGRIHIRDLASGQIRQTFTVTQDGVNCPASGYSISPSNVVIERFGDSFSFEAQGPPGCMPGLPSIDVDWIRLNTCFEFMSESRKLCFFDTRSNPGNFRIGTIDVSGQKFFVYQNPQGCPIELICSFFPAACGLVEEPTAEVKDANVLDLSRKFRDVKLARSPRGQQYISLYYQFSPEAVQTMMFNPMLMLRSHEILERYKPVIEAIVRGEDVTLSHREVDEINGFLQSFASKGSGELRNAVNGVCEDLRNPRTLSEFGITLIEGPVRERTPQGQIHGVIKTSFATLFGFSLLLVYRAARKQTKSFRKLKVLGIVLMLVGAPLVDSDSRMPKEKANSVFSMQAAPKPTNALRFPITFEANQGQTDPDVEFLSRTAGYNLYLTTTEAEVRFRKPGRDLTQSNAELRMRLIGANADSHWVGVDPLPGRTNYFIGRDPALWRTGLSTFTKVKFEKVYPGIDMVYYGNNGELEYDFIVLQELILR